MLLAGGIVGGVAYGGYQLEEAARKGATSGAKDLAEYARRDRSITPEKVVAMVRCSLYA